MRAGVPHMQEIASQQIVRNADIYRQHVAPNILERSNGQAWARGSVRHRLPMAVIARKERVRKISG